MGKIGEIDELLKIFPDLEVFFGATLEEVPGPEDKHKKKISTLVKRKSTL